MRWMWIDRVVLLEPRQRMVAIKNVTMAEEHLHDTLPSTPLMPASLIIEGMAQTAGILVGHANGFKEKVILAKVSKAELTEDAPPGYTLRYTATIQHMDALGASTQGVVELLDPAKPDPAKPEAARQIGVIDLMFSHIDHNLAGQEFPEHNFVFSELFRTLLETSGLKTWGP
jgi:3-hydroxyacyl-[acyl-carrier-protein] dehydratase